MDVDVTLPVNRDVFVHIRIILGMVLGLSLTRLVSGMARFVQMLSVLLFPDQIDEYKGYADYFQSRRRWFYSFLAMIFVLDVIDTWIKGPEHFHALGLEYPIRQAVFALCSLVAVLTPSQRFQAVFVTVGVVYQTTWIFRQFNVLN